jgi:Protein of unknown function (DUF2851)
MLKMNEQFLQFVWQHRYFDQSELYTISNEPVIVIDPGTHNTNQGPDFSGARIRLGETEWAGNVELHVQTADWLRHGHQHDKQYQNVILHVVWEHSEPVELGIPVLELQGRVPAYLKKQVIEWMDNQLPIPCVQELHMSGIQLTDNWKEILVRERLSRKSVEINDQLRQLKGHWEEVFWWLIARNFGVTVNSDAFGEMARSLPLTLITRHKNQIQQVEALLLGQCGLLNEKFSDPYVRLLQKEYQFLRDKYKLRQIKTPVQFLRMRPGNFPTIRLAQLAMLIHESIHLFSKIKELKIAREVEQLFLVTANDFWHYHYRLGNTSAYVEKTLGNKMIQNLLINTVIPSLFTYGQYMKDDRYVEKAMRWLEETEPEKNNIIRIFQQEGITVKNATDTQALLELKKNYCDKRRCLECEIGMKLLSLNP